MKTVIFHSGEGVSPQVKELMARKTGGRVLTSPIAFWDDFFASIPPSNEPVRLIAFAPSVSITSILDVIEKIPKQQGTTVYTIRYGCASKTLGVNECIQDLEQWDPDLLVSSINS